MHHPDSTPRQSLYFPYRVFAPWLPDGIVGSRLPVVVVGAGPVGLVTALLLAQQGVRVVVLESTVQISEGSRAIVFTRRSLEILQQVGVADAVVGHGLPWHSGNSFYKGQRVFRLEAPSDPHDRFPPLINLQQQFLEQYLLEAAERLPNLEIRWGNHVADLAQYPGHAILRVETPGGGYEIMADWVVAADGARSALRRGLGLKLEGDAYEGSFVIADIRIDLPLPTERLAFFDPEWNPGNTVLMHREPQGLWRIDYQLPAQETPAEALQPAALTARIDAQLEMIGFGGTPWTLDWSSVYSARALTLADYRCGRTLFVGDSAHLLPIFGVRGANTGIQDAQALAWRLALVARGVAADSLLAGYSDERVTAAREVIAEAGKSTRFMTPPSCGFRLLRDAVLSLSLTEDFVRPLFHWRTSRAHAYATSTLNSRHDGNLRFLQGPANGEVALNARLEGGRFLLDYLGPSFTLLWFSPLAPPSPALRAAFARWSASGLPLRVIRVGGNGGEEGFDHWLADPQGEVARRYGLPSGGGAYLLRPDQHVCARWTALDLAQLPAGMESLRQLLLVPGGCADGG